MWRMGSDRTTVLFDLTPSTWRSDGIANLVRIMSLTPFYPDPFLPELLRCYADAVEFSSVLFVGGVETGQSIALPANAGFSTRSNSFS